MTENHRQKIVGLVKAVAIFTGQMVVVAVWAFLIYAYMMLTPDQMSAECEHEYYLMEQRP